MSYSQFIMAVFAIYVVYYTANFLYDAFLKQGKVSSEKEEEVFSIGDNEEEMPHNVIEEDFETNFPSDKSEQEYVTVNEAVEMEVETQGIPMELLLAKGKDMFSQVDYK